MAPLAPDQLLRALGQLPVLLLRPDEQTGELMVAHVAAGGRAFFGVHLAPGQPWQQALPLLSAAAQVALLNTYHTGQPARLDLAAGGAPPAPGMPPARGRSFQVEATLDEQGTIDGLLLSGSGFRAANGNSATAARLAGLPLITYRASADGQRTEYLSPQWFAFTGQPANSPDPAAAWAAALHPDDLADLRFRLGPALQDRQPWTSEVRLRGQDGEYRWFLVQTGPELDAAGRLSGWQGVCLDVHERRLTQERLRRREAQVSFLIETIPQLVWTADSHGGLTWVSEQWIRYTGLSLAQSAGSGWTTALHPDDQRATHGYWAATIAAGTDADLHLRLRAGNGGHYRWFVMRAHAQQDEQGRSTGWFGTATDVHELRETRVQLEAKDQLLSQILGEMPAVVATFSGPEHRYTFVNAAYHRLTRYRARLGETVADCLPAAITVPFKALLDQVYSTGEVHFSPEVLVKAKAGAEGPALLYFDITYQPLRDAQGQITGIVAFGIDVTHRRQARQQTQQLQAQVQAADQHLRRLTEALPVITFTTDAEGRTTYMSPQWYCYTGQPTGGPLSEVDDWWTQVLHPADALAAGAEIEASIREGKLGRIELRLRGADGRYRWFLTEAVPELDEHGRLRQRYGFMLDIEELRQVRLQLENKDQVLSQILGQTPALMATVSGPEHHFTFTNAAYEQLMGRRPRLGCTVAECLPAAVAPAFCALLDEVYRSGQAYISPETLIELPGPDGQVRRHYLNFTYQPLRDGQGRISGILALGVEVTDQVLARQRAAELQAALGAQDERLRTMTEALPQITYIASREAGIEYVSPQWYAYTGQAPGTLLNDNWLSYVHPDDLPRVQAELDQNRNRAAPWQYELRLRRHDGQYRWHLSQGAPEPGALPGAAPARWYGSDTDIHELRELQEELRRGQARYRALTDKIPRQVWTANGEGELDFYNERAAAYFGRDMQQLPPADWLAVVHPDDCARVAARWLESVSRVQPYEAEFRLRRHDGRYRWHLSQAAPEVDESGRVRRWYGTNTDIQDQRELEQTLRRSEEQFRFLAESLPQIVWTSFGTNEHDYMNQRWYDYTGLDPVADRTGANWRAVIHPDDLALTNARWAHSVATGEFFEVEYRFRRHDGQYRWFLGQGRAQRRPDGSVLKWFGTCTDIDDQKQSQQLLRSQNEQLRRINADLDQFVYTASHDLRQPINNMAGIFEELTRTAYFRDPDAVLLIAMFEKSLAQIDDTIQELTAIVQVQRRQQAVPAEAVALAPLAQEVVGSLQGQISALAAEVALDFAACPTLPFVRAQLQSVLLNLLSNALKYAAPGRPPRVRLSAHLDAADQHPVLLVQDNGRGIDLARHGGELFQLFSRFHPEVEGSGMGLYLVNRVVESHGGRLEVESEVGTGTTFRVHLPAAEAEVDGEEAV